MIMVLLGAVSCEDDACLKGSGDHTVDTRPISGNITELEINDNLNVDVYFSIEGEAVVEGGENVVPFIKTEVENGRLKISNDNSCTFLRDFDESNHVTLYIPFPDVIEYNGSGNVTFHDTLKGDQLQFDSYEGTGSIEMTVDLEFIHVHMENELVDLTLSGSSSYARIDYNKAGWFFGKDFNAILAEVYTSSTGDCIISVKDSINCIVNGIGNIQYLGEPAIVIHENNGKGKVIPYSE